MGKERRRSLIAFWIDRCSFDTPLSTSTVDLQYQRSAESGSFCWFHHRWFEGCFYPNF